MWGWYEGARLQGAGQATWAGHAHSSWGSCHRAHTLASQLCCFRCMQHYPPVCSPAPAPQATRSASWSPGWRRRRACCARRPCCARCAPCRCPARRGASRARSRGLSWTPCAPTDTARWWVGAAAHAPCPCACLCSISKLARMVWQRRPCACPCFLPFAEPPPVPPRAAADCTLSAWGVEHQQGWAAGPRGAAHPAGHRRPAGRCALLVQGELQGLPLRSSPAEPGRSMAPAWRARASTLEAGPERVQPSCARSSLRHCRCRAPRRCGGTWPYTRRCRRATRPTWGAPC